MTPDRVSTSRGPQAQQGDSRPVDSTESLHTPKTEGSPPKKSRITKEVLASPQFQTLLVQRYVEARQGGKDGMLSSQEIDMADLEEKVLQEIELKEQAAKKPVTQIFSPQPDKLDASNVPHKDLSELADEGPKTEFVPLREAEKKIKAWYNEEDRNHQIMLSVLYRGLIEASKIQISIETQVAPRTDVGKLAQRLSELCAVGPNNTVDIYRLHRYSVHTATDAQSFENEIRQKLRNPVEVNLQEMKSMEEDVTRRIRPMLDFWAWQPLVVSLVDEIKRKNKAGATHEDQIAAAIVLKTLNLYINTYTSDGKFLSKKA